MGSLASFEIFGISTTCWNAVAAASLAPTSVNNTLDAVHGVPGVLAPARVRMDWNARNGARLFLMDNGLWTADQITEHFRFPVAQYLQSAEDHAAVRNELGLYYRPLLYAGFSELNADILFLGAVETNRGFREKGLCGLFYEELLRSARNAGFRYLAHFHETQDVARFFLKRGARRLEDFPGLKAEFEPVTSLVYNLSHVHTVQFLDPAERPAVD